jgi:CRISPR-associated endonuclease/helicase Cas3
MSVSRDFDEFFAALWPTITERPAPFPWQRALVRRVERENCWPRTLDLPTGTGKTAVLDIAIWMLAGRNPNGCFPRRIFFVVDRRMIVDEAAARARSIRDRLREARSGILRQVADCLREVGGSEEPLEVSVMRGGMPRERAWVSSPAQPAIILSTVDQLGSRLLFRGYGVTPEMAPIHAGLAATDSLIFLDEAHLSTPFLETLNAIQIYSDDKWRTRAVASPLVVVSMSATLGQLAEFEFQETYEEGDRPSAELRRRLQAHKSANLVEVRTEIEPSDQSAKRKWRRAEPERRAALAQRAADLSMVALEEPRVRVVGVVVNRVATAREIFSRLTASRDAFRHGADLLLLTGRCRALDRDLLLAAHWPRLKAGRARAETDSPLIVIATQCIETGANIDFDALVTEIASLDALRQRFGRLDRLGQFGAPRAQILARTDQVHRRASPDPIYCEAAKGTWKFLRDSLAKKGEEKSGDSVTAIDFGVSWLKLPTDKLLEKCLTPRKSAPVLLPAHLDLFCQTSPRPQPDPDPAIFLHGPSAGPADVSIVWRADLDPDAPEDWEQIVSFLPPASAEAMPVPLYAVRAWLTGRSDAASFADVEGGPVEVVTGSDRQRVLLWQGTESKIGRNDRAAEANEAQLAGTRVVTPEEVFPGCTIIVPSVYGGADVFGWNPQLRGGNLVADHGDVAFSHQRNRPVLRMHAGVLRSWLGDEITESVKQLVQNLRALEANDMSEDRDETEPLEKALALLRRIAVETLVPEAERKLATELLATSNTVTLKLYPKGDGFVLIGTHRPCGSQSMPPPVHLDEGNYSSFGTTRPVLLDEHLVCVRETVDIFAARCGLATNGLHKDLLLAARLHDLGKCDRRFQALLHRGDRVAAAAGPPLAKSAARPASADEARRERERVGLPAGWRHETLTLSLLADHQPGSADPLSEARDRDLVLHLIATHHGYCRAIAPIVDDPAAPPARVEFGDWHFTTDAQRTWVSLDCGLVDRFWRLVRAYGWFGLAYLEALLRLADHRASADELLRK